MKNLRIVMTIKANSKNEAETIVKSELMDLAMVLGRNNGSMMAMGEGNVAETSDGKYKAEATLKLDGNGNVNDIVYTAQCLWMTKPNILKSAIFVNEEESTKVKEPEAPKVKTAECKRCGQVEPIDDLSVVNPEMEDEYYLCEECYEDAQNEDEIIDCCNCMNTVDVDKLVANPVTYSRSICPICGENLWNA